MVICTEHRYRHCSSSECLMLKKIKFQLDTFRLLPFGFLVRHKVFLNEWILAFRDMDQVMNMFSKTYRAVIHLASETACTSVNLKDCLPIGVNCECVCSELTPQTHRFTRCSTWIMTSKIVLDIIMV